MLAAIGAAVGPAVGEAIGGAVSGAITHTASRPETPAWQTKLAELKRQLPTSPRVLAFFGLFLAGTGIFAAYRGDWDYGSDGTRLMSVFTNACPEASFGSSFFGAEVGGIISTTLEGWEANVQCDGGNEYSGPVIACGRVKLTGFDLRQSRMEVVAFVRKEDLSAERPRAISPSVLTCRKRVGVSRQPGSSMFVSRDMPAYRQQDFSGGSSGGNALHAWPWVMAAVAVPSAALLVFLARCRGREPPPRSFGDLPPDSPKYSEADAEEITNAA
eukprot:TRINITY_DN10041_c0_g1_i3.p1 TRINITY_DN10041_c0_g1~~TRINITY_DN10041_c0_g1_i3.p1  ORF type:complete len:272 (+),score=41.30 TRINITY_DN10041_c0_g1_i3:138-953(+)